MYGIKEIPFCDTEFEVDGLKQIWGGEFHVDQDETIVGISREWLGDGENRIHYDVPSRFCDAETLAGKAALTLAKVLEKDCRDEIKDAVNEYAVDCAERSWSPRSEYGTHRAIRGRVA